MSAKRASKPGIGQKVFGFFIRLLFLILRMTDIRLVALAGTAVGYLTWAIFPSRRRIVARNLRIAANPELKGKELSSLVRKNIVRTCVNMACTFKTGLLTDKELKRSATLIGDNRFREDAEKGDCIICCIPHAGNWEMLARLRPVFQKVKRYGSLYRRLDNPVLEKAVYDIRTRYGCEMFNIKNGLKDIFRLSRDGGLLGVLSDQFTQQGIYIPYFGKVTGTTTLPALIYKRRKENVHLYAVASRTQGLGQWEVDFSHEVQIPATEESSIEDITMRVNLELEKVQSLGILDGFWMHHRWKSTMIFAPYNDEKQNEIIRKYARLPFRIIICLPEEFEEALITIPMLRCLKNCRPDMELSIVCPAEQKAFWQTQAYIDNVATTNEQESPADQLEAPELYKKGPYDYLFMLSSNKRVFKNLQRFMPMFISGFACNPLSKAFNNRVSMAVGEEPQHKVKHYEHLLRWHIVTRPGEYPDPATGNAEATGNFIAPFSTLGDADSWETGKWKELVSALGSNTRLLALEQDSEKAEKLAEELGIGTVLVRPENVATVLGPQCMLYAVDGLLPQLAALVGSRCHVIMASRLAAVYAPLGAGHHTVSNHTPCHPCYARSCDQQPSCSAGITIKELMGA